MSPKSVVIYRVYQLSSHRTLGFYTGEEEAIPRFCKLKYGIEEDDVAIERVQVRTVTRSDVMCFGEVLDQMREYMQRLKELEAQADSVGVREEVLQMVERPA